MDSCCANLNGNVHLVKASKQGFRNRGTGFWGESIRGSLKGRGLSAQLLKSLKSESRVRKLTPGASYSVLTSNINKESVVSQNHCNYQIFDTKSIWEIDVGIQLLLNLNFDFRPFRHQFLRLHKQNPKM